MTEIGKQNKHLAFLALIEYNRRQHSGYDLRHFQAD